MDKAREHQSYDHFLTPPEKLRRNMPVNISRSPANLAQMGIESVFDDERKDHCSRKRKNNYEISRPPAEKKSTFDHEKEELNAWITAAKEGDLDTLKRMYDFQSYDVKTANGVNGRKTALHLASGIGRVEVVKELLRLKADVNAKSITGVTPLMDACKGSHAEVVEILLNSGADIQMKSTQGDTVFHFAVRGRNDDIIYSLAKAAGNPESIDSQQFPETSSSFVESAPESLVSQVLPVTNPETDKKESAECAIRKSEGSPEGLTNKVFKRLGELLIDSNNKHGETPLLLAAAKGYCKVVETLIFCDADVNRTNNEGENALHIAAKGGFTSVGKCLLRAGCNETATHTPLEGKDWEIRYKNSHRECDESFIKLENPHTGRTPLELAIEFSQIDFARCLFSDGDAMRYFKYAHPNLKLDLFNECKKLHADGFVNACIMANKSFFKGNRKLLFSENSCRGFSKIEQQLDNNDYKEESDLKNRICSTCHSIGNR